MSENKFEYTHIAGAKTTQVATGGALTLHYITVNKTDAGAITIYDEAAGATTTTVAILQASVLPGTFRYDAMMLKGIQIVTAAASDLTICWSRG
jgi:hypothetical protein